MLGPLVSGLLTNHTGFLIPVALHLSVSTLLLVLLMFLNNENLKGGEGGRKYALEGEVGSTGQEQEQFNPICKHNTFVTLWNFMVNYADQTRGILSEEGKKKKLSLRFLALIFCLCFSDLVGQAMLFFYYAILMFKWSPAFLG